MIERGGHDRPPRGGHRSGLCPHLRPRRQPQAAQLVQRRKPSLGRACGRALGTAQGGAPPSAPEPDAIKIWSTGGGIWRWDKKTDQHYTFEEIKAVVDECNMVGIPVWSHAEGFGGAWIPPRQAYT